MARRMGEAPLPPAPRTRVRRLTGTAGLDRRPGAGEGSAEDLQGFDPRVFPSLSTIKQPIPILRDMPGNHLSLHAVGTSLFIVYEEGGTVYLWRRRENGEETRVAMTTENLTAPRTILPFNRYSDPEDPLSGSWRHMAVVYPDGLWFEPEAEEISFETLTGTGGAPEIEHACVHLSRVFGAKGDRLYACAYNDPGNWNLDTASDVSAANAWASTVQSNTNATGDFTALCVYDGHVLAFKRGFCHILNNNKNPFRVADLLTLGTADARTVAEVEGKLFFVGEDGVYRYNGAAATLISGPLGELDYTGALAAGVGGLYYLYLPTERRVYLYAESTGAWSSFARFAFGTLVGMATDGKRCWMLSDRGDLYATDSSDFGLFTLVTTVAVADAIGRPCRFSIALTADPGDLEVKYTDTSGRTTLLQSAEDMYGTVRLISRVFTPADYGGKLTLSGVGTVTVHEMALTVAEEA